MLISLMSLITTILIIDINYVFAYNKYDKTNSNDNDVVNQNDDQNNQCKDSARCDNQSLEQLNNQNNQCKDSARCINQSTSNIVVCREKSVCLVQFQGPFELLNPY